MCICPLCVAVVDKDQTVNPCVSVPDSALHVWPGGAKISNRLVIICTFVQILSSGNYQWKGTSERNVQEPFVSAEAWLSQLRKRVCVCGAPVRLRLARERSASFISAISDKNGEEDV